MADIDTTFMQQILDIVERKRKSDIQHYRQVDDLGRCLEIAKRIGLGHAGSYESTQFFTTKFPLTTP